MNNIQGNFHVSLISSNSKTGPIMVTTSGKQTCPNVCPLKANGCYAESSFLGAHWQAVTAGKRGTDYTTLLDTVYAHSKGRLWRLNQAGDLVGLPDGQTINQGALHGLVKANRGKVIAYTHYAVLGQSASALANRYAIRQANKAGFVINLSANNYEEADRLASLDIAPVVTMQEEGANHTEYTPEGRKVITCPATYMEHVSCASCGLCAIGKDKGRPIIGFPVHGVAKAKALKVFNLKQV